MKALTTVGVIIELVQDDCLCVTHTGPHWLHMDAIARSQNVALLEAVGRMIATAKTYTDINYCNVMMNCFCELEMVRLRIKGDEMRRHGLVRLVEDAPPEGGGK